MYHIKAKHNILTIPNLLSFSRMCLIPFIVWQYAIECRFGFAAILVILSGVTDVVDGIIARKFNMVSRFGKILDPIADKLTQIAVLFCLIIRFHHMVVPLIVLILKETLAGILGFILIHKTGIVNGAKWHGKLSTVFLYSLMILHIIWFNIPPILSDLLIGLSLLFMILSAALYTVSGIRSYVCLRHSQLQQ